jgi:hypothetical protein
VSNFPDGMTQSDWRHVNGPDFSGEEEVDCEECGGPVLVTVDAFAGDEEVEVECPEGHRFMFTLPEPDYESIAEARAEAAADRWADWEP